MSDTDTNGVSRRNLLTGLGAGAGILGLAGVAPAKAALLPEPETRETYDVVVIGSGLAGCAAALEAASTGARVALIEKMGQSRAGGNSALAGGGFAISRSASESAQSSYVRDFVEKGLGRGNQNIYRLMAANARADLDWLRNNGVEFLAESESSLYEGVSTAVVAPGMYMGMPRMLKGLRDLIVSKGGVLLFDTKARQLILDDRGAVAGVRAAGPNGVIDCAAKSVVIATGGYAGNPQILEAYSDANAGALMVRGIEWATGDGLMLAQEAGAGLRGMGGLMALHIAAVDPVETAAGNPSSALPYCLGINRDGKRYVDESKGYVAHGKAALMQPGQQVSLIFDENTKTLPGASTSINTFSRLGITMVEASSLDELAGKIGVPPEALKSTVAEFNASVNDGQALGASPPKEKLAYKIEGPNFFAFHPLVPGVTLTFGGIMINERAQVLEADGRVVPGLYAAGEGAGHLYFDDYIGGGALTNCLVMGRIAGREAVTA